MILSLIAAIGKNNELGFDNKLLWNMPADMKHFRDTTSGHPVIMGRKTFESIGQPLPNRRNIVITRDMNYKNEGSEVFHSLDESLELFVNSDEEVFCIGGAEIYKLALSKADRLYITKIDADFEADTFFPEIDGNDFSEESREHHTPDEKNKFPYTFLVYKKIDKIY